MINQYPTENVTLVLEQNLTDMKGTKREWTWHSTSSKPLEMYPWSQSMMEQSDQKPKLINVTLASKHDKMLRVLILTTGRHRATSEGQPRAQEDEGQAGGRAEEGQEQEGAG